MQIVEVDGHDPAEFEKFFKVRDDVRRAEQEFPVGLGQEETRGLFTGNDPDERSNGLGLVDGDTWLGMAWLDWWLTENTHAIDVEIAVDPRFRRQGVATRLLDEVAARAKADGRTLLTTSVIASPSGTSSGTAFAEARGFVQKHTELHQVIELPMDDAVVDALDRRCRGTSWCSGVIGRRTSGSSEFADALHGDEPGRAARGSVGGAPGVDA